MNKVRLCLLSVASLLAGCDDSSTQRKLETSTVQTNSSPETSPSAKPLPYSLSEQKAYEIAYQAIAKKLGYSPPQRREWRYWTSTLSSSEAHDYRMVWRIGADFAPAGGGRHGFAVVDANTGEVLQVVVGEHLR